MLVPGTNLLVGGGKEGKFYLLDRGALGGFHAGSDDQIPQSFFVNQNHHIHGAPSAWTGPRGALVYVWPEVDFLRAYAFSGNRFVADAAGNVVPAAMGTAGQTQGMPGGLATTSATSPSLVWRGRDPGAHINQMTPRDGVPQHATDKRTFYDTTRAGPAVCSVGDHMFLSWTGTDPQSRVNVAVLGLGSVSVYGLA
ncbi:MAG: hypothetical protein M3O36_03050 [Myxococcota bacterium]|nr:hypothetical protein [Myxococcota bacterium]